MTDGSTLPVHYLRHIADQVRAMGGDAGRWLAASGLSEPQLDDPSLTVRFPEFARLVSSALSVTGEPALGLLVGERLVASTHGIVGYAAMSSSTIRDALDLLERYVQLRISVLSVAHEIDGQRVRIRFAEARPLGEIRRPVLEAVVLSVKNILDSISMGACPVLEVAFAFDAPEYVELASDLFGCDVGYERDWTGLVIPAAVLDTPLKKADPESFRAAAQICQRELDKLEADVSHAARVRRLMLEKQHGFPSLQVTARLFHMTPRTLHRRLIEEGTSYREILEETRHALAVQHIESRRFSMEEIAFTLGYSDLLNFRRAFKRWQSVPPATYRAQRRTRST